MAICNRQADSPLYVRSDVRSGNVSVEQSKVIHDTECPYLRPGAMTQQQYIFQCHHFLDEICDYQISRETSSF